MLNDASWYPFAYTVKLALATPIGGLLPIVQHADEWPGSGRLIRGNEGSQEERDSYLRELVIHVTLCNLSTDFTHGL